LAREAYDFEPLAKSAAKTREKDHRQGKETRQKETAQI
jgi:hypothetical protein